MKQTNIITTEGIGNLFTVESFKGWLRGPAQVMFQGNALCGALFMAAIFVGAAVEGRMEVAWGAVVGLSISTLTGHILALPSHQGEAGLWGFNGVLVGIAAMTFLGSTLLGWAALVLFAAMSTWVRTALDRLCSAHKVSSMTAPFVLCCWLLLAASRSLGALDAIALPSASLPITVWHHHTIIPFNFLETIFRGISQVFLLDSWVAGVLFVMGLLASRPLAALWAIVGSALASGVALLFGAGGHQVAEGLYAFSPVLTAIALGATFYRPSLPTALWTLLGIIATVFIQAALNALLAPVGLPTFTAPFCLATWLFLLPLYRFDADHKEAVNHSSWHRKEHHNKQQYKH